MAIEMLRLPLPEPKDDAHPLDWYPEDSEAIGLPGTLTETSYTLPEGLNLGQWLAVGETLQRMERSVMWWLGDWWRYGERNYDQSVYQSIPDMVKRATGHAYQTVRDAGWVAGKFDASLRRDDVSWQFHKATAVLPSEDAQHVLDEVVEHGLTIIETRDRVKERKTAITIEAARLQPAPLPEQIPSRVNIQRGDAAALPHADESVHLIVTSPPYAVGKDYEHGDIDPEQWLSFCYGWMREAFRVAVPNGRFALNVPLDTTLGGFRPVYSQAVQMALAAGWTYRSSIIWADDQLGKSIARGSVDSAGAPSIIAGAEMVALFSKGEWRREPPAPAPAGDQSWLQHDEWLDWTNGLWRLTGETQAWEAHPAPFPYELPRRLIKLLSFPGDTVLDPFTGSGTTALAAYRLGRDFEGIDISQSYVDSALRRVVQRGVAA